MDAATTGSAEVTGPVSWLGNHEMLHKLSTTDTPPIDRAGGKALSLIEAIRAGFPVVLVS